MLVFITFNFITVDNSLDGVVPIAQYGIMLEIGCLIINLNYRDRHQLAV